MLANFSNLITFSRGSNATLTDASGRLTYAPHNLLPSSQDFEATTWVKSNVAVTANALTAPDGSITADTLTENSANGDHSVARLAALTQTSLLSVYAKAGTRNILALGESSNGTYAKFDLSSGVVLSTGTGQISGGAITPAGDGWYRCSCIYTHGGVNRSLGIPMCDASGNVSYSGNGTGNLYLWGAQLEAVTYQTTPSPYVSTSVANLLGFSEDFTNAVWTKSNCSVVIGMDQNPINNLWNAQKLMVDTATAIHRVAGAATVNVIAGVRYTLSVYAKAAGTRYLYMNYAAQLNAASTFDLQTGTVSATASGTASITSVGNGWYRCSVTGIAPATAGSTFYLQLNDTGVASDRSYTGDGNSGIYIYGAQLSNSGSLDPYVPTPGAAPSSTAYYGPRYDYDPVTLAPKGILIEEQRTNLLTLSENIAGAAWFVVNIASRTANTSTSPSGTVTAGTLTDDTTTARHVLYNTITLGSSGVYTFSVYLKQGTGRYVQVQLSAGSSATSIGVIADLLNGTITDTKIGASATNTASSITSFGNGWYRVSVTCQCASGTVYPIIAGSDSATPTYDAFFNPTYTGTGQTRLIWGAQLEAGAFATSYIPTVASQVTRTADVAQITGSLFSQWYNGSEGTLVADVQKLSTSASAPYAWELIGASSNFSMRVRLGADSRMQSVDGGAVQADAQLATPVLTTPAKYAMAYRLNDYAGSTGGAAVATDTSGTVPAVTTLSIGSAAVANVYVRNITYIPNRISNDQLQAATT